jgi:hypothetical protein
LGRGSVEPENKNATTGTEDATDAIPTQPINPRSRRAFAITHAPANLRITPEQLRAVLDWYESQELIAAFRESQGTPKQKPRRKVARLSAVVKPKAKKELERVAKRHDMTQGELIEQLLTFADRVKTMNRKGGDR